MASSSAASQHSFLPQCTCLHTLLGVHQGGGSGFFRRSGSLGSRVVLLLQGDQKGKVLNLVNV